MGMHPARLTDLPAIRRLDRNGFASVLSPSDSSRMSSAVSLALLSSWRGFGPRSLTVVLRRGPFTRGFVQSQARPGRESWDIVRLACVASDADAWTRGCADLLDRISAATAQRGALRTFARIMSESERLELLIDSGFRPYATEITWSGRLRPLVESAGVIGDDVRSRITRDAWDIFSLYCAVTPALVRHAEGRGVKEWTLRNRSGAMPVRRGSAREVVVGEPGEVRAWVRCTPARQHHPQILDVLAQPDMAERLPELLRFAAESLFLDIDALTLCRAREYDGRISATLEGAGFDAVARETLLVRHTVARVPERQLLVAALRTQGLGIDLSHYRRGAEAAHQRLASSREVEHHYYDREYRTSYYG